MNDRTWITLSSSAFRHNMATIKAIIGNIHLGVVIKANAYGHGIIPIAQFAQANNAVDFLCVASAREALLLRSVGITKTILVMAVYDAPLEEIIHHDLVCTVYDKEIFDCIDAVGRQMARKVPVHIKIDTGMSRLGFMPQEFCALLPQLARYEHVDVVGVFSHCADTNNPDLHGTYNHIQQFEQVVWACQKAGLSVMSHLFASGTLFLPQTYSAVRVGGMIYGFWKSAVHRERLQAINSAWSLKQMMTWKTRVIMVRQQTAILPIGYADGYPAKCCGMEVIVNNSIRARVEIVEMCYTVISVSGLVTIGDEVILMGDYPGISADDYSKHCGMITNEILTGISAKIPRYVVE